LFKQSGNGNRDEGMALMEEPAAVRPGSGRGRLPNNDEMAIGAYLALQARGTLGHHLSARIDASPDALQYLSADPIRLSRCSRTPRGRHTPRWRAGCRPAARETVEKEILISYELVTPDKRDDYLKIWGVCVTRTDNCILWL
jgi:hypothetical protein